MFYLNRILCSLIFLMVSFHANANSEKIKDFLKCVDRLEYNQSVERSISACGAMLQKEMDSINSDGLDLKASKNKSKESGFSSFSSPSSLKEAVKKSGSKSIESTVSKELIASSLLALNYKIEKINDKNDGTILPYEIYDDKLDKKSLSNISTLNKVRESLRKYKGLSYFDKFNPSAAADDMKLNFARSNRTKDSTYRNLQRSISRLEKSAPDLDLTSYKEVIAKFKDEYDTENQFFEFVAQIKNSVYTLNKISNYSHSKGLYSVGKNDWGKVPEYKMVEKLSKIKALSNMKPIFEEYFSGYEKARSKTEKNILEVFFETAYKKATTYTDPIAIKYFLPNTPDHKIQSALKELKKEVSFWRNVFPGSNLLAEYENNMPDTELVHKEALESGREAYRKRVLLDLEQAKVPTTDALQDAIGVRAVHEIANNYFRTNAELIDALGNKVLSVGILGSVIQTSGWKIYFNGNQALRQEMHYTAIVEDENGGCHAVTMLILQRYNSNNELGGFVLNDFTPMYPLMCDRV